MVSDNAAAPKSGRRRFLGLVILGAVAAPFVATSGSSVTPAATSNLQCATSRPVISQSDITYLGALRLPSSIDTSFSYGGMTGRVVNGRTRFFVYGNNLAGDPVFEVEDPGSGYNPDYTQAPRANLITSWGDIYHGKRVTWDASGNVVTLTSQLLPDSLYWNENTQLLYWTYFDSYNVTGRPDWALGATHLDDPGSAASTAYGPWRALATDADGGQHYGAWRCRYLFANPLDSTMMCGSTISAGNAGSPWGPDAYGGMQWPTQSTPGGRTAPDLSLPSRYLEYYFMGNVNSGNFVDTNGVVHGNLRSFRRRTEQPLWEAGPYPLRANQALNGGVSSWTEMDTVSGGIWLELTNKRAVMFNGMLVGSTNQNTGDCTNAAHEWYSSAGANPPIGACSHGCAPPYNITGPVTTAAFPALIIYDPDQLVAVKNGTVPDYSVEPAAVIDLEQAYHIRTPNIGNVGEAKSVRGFYFDPVRKLLFMLSPMSDDSVSPYQVNSLIHVFQIND
jgi:hypothetical protein